MSGRFKTKYFLTFINNRNISKINLFHLVQKNFPDELEFVKAELECRKEGGELVQILSEDENELIRKFSKDDPAMDRNLFWIGGFCDEGEV